MRTVLACLVALFLVSTDAPQAQAACGLLGPDKACQELRTRTFVVDFTPDQPQKPVVLHGRPVVVVLPHLPQPAHPIDCEMVRWVESSIDPQIAKRPPADIEHSMRVVEVPGCPKPESRLARIR
jgi:hypothetical protein